MNTITQKNYKVILNLIIAFLIVAISASIFVYNAKKVYADANSQLSFEKIKTEIYIDGDGYISGYNESEISKSITINDGDFVLLDNTDARIDILEKKGSTSGTISTKTTEGVLITFGINTPVKMLTISATLNGRQIKTNDPTTDPTTSCEKFEQIIFGLPYELSYYDAQTGGTEEIVDPTGEIIFSYRYSPYINGVTGSPVEGNFTFRILSQYDYSYTAIDGEIDPVNNNYLYNTFTILDDDNHSLVPSDIDTESHFFNYNNFNTSTISTGTLQYPTLKYDATKYNLSWTKKLQNNTYYTTSNLTVLEDKSAYVVYTTTFGNTSSTQIINIENIDKNPIVEIEFSEIGLYKFSFSYMVRTTGVSYQISSNLTPKEKTLEIFGYQLKYAQNKTGSKELLSTEDNLFADISTINSTYINSNEKNIQNLTFFNFSDGNVIYDYIPKTNQAPLWFDFLGNLSTSENTESKIYYIPNTINLKDCTNENLTDELVKEYSIKTNYTKNKFFSSAGLYFVEINYTYTKFTEQTFTQLFCFEITNSSPEISLIGLNESEDGENLTNGQYTNLNINVDWNKGSVFDANVYATYTLYNYDNTTIQTGYENLPLYPINSGNPTTLTKNGVYKIKLYYGNSAYTFSTYSITIDKQPINQVKYLIQNYSENYNLDITDALSSLPILNENFKLSYADKQSGAKIYGEYQAILIIEDNTYEVNSNTNLVNKENEYYLLNGWKTSDVSSKLTFDDTTIFSNQGIYLFHIYDEAGNEFYSYVVLDKTNPVMLFDPSIDNDFNIISEDTTVTFGTHKAIKLGFNIDNIELKNLKNILNDNLFRNTDNGQYLCVELSSKTYQVGNTAGTAQTAEQKNITSHYINLTIPDDLDEYFYYITLTDKSRIKDRLNVNNTNTSGKTATLIEYNLDKSQVKMLVNIKQSDTQTAEARLYNYGATNQDSMFIQFAPENTGYIVEQLYYDFYPITLDTTSPNYPYSNTKTLSNVNLLNDLTLVPNNDSNKADEYRTQEINLIQVQDPNDTNQYKMITAPGKYVITRTYAFDPELFENENDEKRTKQYIFMVDRIKPIEKLTVEYPLPDTEDYTRIVGNFIKLSLGIENTVDFKNFLSANQSEKEQIILTTDIMPINSIIPYNKYAIDEDGNIIIIDGDGNIINELTQYNLTPYNLNLEIYYDPTSIKFENAQKIEPLEINGNFLNISKLNKIGYYKFILSDNTGYILFDKNSQIEKNNIDPNKFSFIIEVRKEYPTAEFYGNPSSDGTPKVLQSLVSGESVNVISTKDDQLSLVFYDSQNPYKAKIDYTDVKITRRTKGTNTFDDFITITFTDKDTTGQTTYPSSTDLKNLSQVYGLRNLLLDNEGNQIKDLNGNDIYQYTVVIPTQTNSNILYEGEYKIELHYYGEKDDYWNNSNTINYYYNAENSLNIVLDHTAPNFNLIRLVNLDKYIPTSSNDPNVITKSDIYNYAKSILTNAEKKEQVRQFLRTYSFAIPDNFVFLYATNNGFPTDQNFMIYTYPSHDTSSIYFRKYDKYQDSDNSEQSYIISDPEYNDVSKTRFEIANEIYKVYTYFNSMNSRSFASYVLSKEEYGEGYYEIIEIDQAGNQTIYTVYVTEENKKVELDFKDTQTQKEYNSAEYGNSISADYTTVITDIKNLDSWTYINVYNYSSNKREKIQTFNITYQTDIEQLIQDLNDLIAYKSQYSISGAKYELEFVDRKNEGNISIFVQRPGKKLQHKISEGLITFEITLPTSTDSTWIKSFSVYEYDNTIGGLRQLNYDLNNKPITGETNFSNVSYTFNVNECFFFLIDNFDRGYNDPIHYIFGIKDVKDLEFSGDVDYQQDKTVTASETYFTYQELLYNIEVYLDGEKIDFTDNENIILSYNSSNKTKTLTFKKVPNKLFEYEIIVYQTISGISISGIYIEIEPTHLCFTMDTRLPEFELTDQNGNNMNYLITSTGASTSKEVFISWSEEDSYPVTVSIKYENGETSQIRTINRGDSILLEGTYTLSMTNTIGNSISYTFNISQMHAILYDVYSNDKILTPCIENQEFSINATYEEKYIDLNKKMKVYMSIYDFTVVANEQKDLQAVKILEFVDNSYSLQIWKISGETSLFYEEYIALVKINSNALTLDNFTMGTDPNALSKATGIGSSLYNTDVYIHYEPSYTLNINYANEPLVVDKFVYIELYYNNIYVDKFDESDYHFVENGNYKLYFKNIAGKQYSFATAVTSSNYYDINLYNSISFLINGEEPIQNATFNSNVKLTVINQNIYTPNTFSISATLNGQTVNVKDYYTKQGWIFKGYGIWNITMNAKYSGVPIETTYTFTILSNLEAQTSYSFAKINGYEIAKVLKDSETNDITQDLKIKYNVNTLTELYLSTENDDYGHYTITVKVKPSEYKPILYYTFEVWLNQFDVEIISNVPFGSETKGVIKLQLNYYAIYQELGNFRIEISGRNPIEINEKNVGENKISDIYLLDTGVYYIQLWSESGSLISSYKITKLEPLNTIAIIIIAGSAIIVLLLIILFIKLRTRMKVR